MSTSNPQKSPKGWLIANPVTPDAEPSPNQHSFKIGVPFWCWLLIIACLKGETCKSKRYDRANGKCLICWYSIGFKKRLYDETL